MGGMSSGTPLQELRSIDPAIAAFVRNKMRDIFMIFPCSAESTGADLETITIRLGDGTRTLRKRLPLERFGDELFCSSTRRHTSWTGDWSSDVCSSDLAYGTGATPLLGANMVPLSGATDGPPGSVH